MSKKGQFILLGTYLLVGLVACGQSPEQVTRAVVGNVPETACQPGQPTIKVEGEISTADAKQYFFQPFAVGAGTGRVEVAYKWENNDQSGSTPLTSTTVDLGLWDNDGYLTPTGFRGWGGSRQGRLDQAQPPVFVQSDDADRGFIKGPIETGVWYVELGFGAVAPNGAKWFVEITCLAGPTAVVTDNPVDPNHVANAAAGWYFGDFHMHAFHSNPNAPDWDDFIQQSRDAQLDYLMVTEYVTTEHWKTLGAVQTAHPDLLIWPGREVITYFGHVNTHGETPSTNEYRHGLEGISLGDIQAASVVDDALFQVNHPRSFAGPAFQSFCRGCAFELDDQIDWNFVDLIEVVNGPVLATASDVGGPPFPGQIENPFMQMSIDYWEEKLLAGFKITAVSGSDSKGVDDPAERARKGYGSSATAVYADSLSRADIKAALRAGRAYIAARGKANSPILDMQIVAGGFTGTFGDSVAADNATLNVTVTNGAGQLLNLIQNGDQIAQVPILTSPFTHSQPIARNPANEGPLGTFWRVDVEDSQALTVVGNPVYMTAPP